MNKASPKTPRRLIIVRHAHRNKLLGRHLDNGLSAKGKRQTQSATRYLLAAFPELKKIRPDAIRIASSPKKRCLETIGPLSRKLRRRSGRIELEIEPMLDEGGNMRAKVPGVLDAWLNGSEQITLVCSHGDWIEAALKRLTGLDLELAKGGIAVFAAAGKGAKLSALVQTVP